MTKFDITVTSDTVCPWCYVGKKKLERGIASYKASHPQSNDTFCITWHPFYLNPDAPSPGVDKQQYYAEKFGGGARVGAMHQRMASIGDDLGINFKFGGKIGSTRDSHRLIQLGKSNSPEMQTKVVEQLFERYFENEQDISDKAVLQEAGTQAGLPAEAVHSWLASDNGGKEVDTEVVEARSNLITGVPNFVIQGKYEIKGAQEPEGFKRIFEKIKEAEG
ncbi:MAG: hypothetical protein MMC23_008459 [Stictis urceolatum]|nr:hypothetical protein [Stictis urceolata]